MTEELQELRERVQQLQREAERLQREKTSSPIPPAEPVPSNAASNAANGDTSSRLDAVCPERVVYIPRERKCPVFRGSSGITVEDWVEEIKACVRMRQMHPFEQAYYIYDHLEGEAKDEIRYRPREDREDPDKILSILQEMYGCAKSHVSLQQSFFSRRQLEGETLQEFSHALCCLMEKIERCAPKVMLNAPVMLRDQFIEHVLDPALRRELKRFARQYPESSLLDVRTEAIRWEREGYFEQPRVGSYTVVPSASSVQHVNMSPANVSKSEIAELKAMLLKQQEQLNHLTQGLLALQTTSKSSAQARAPNVVCRRCLKPGHYARECVNERAPQPQNKQPRGQQVTEAISIVQDAGNFLPLM